MTIEFDDVVRTVHKIRESMDVGDERRVSLDKTYADFLFKIIESLPSATDMILKDQAKYLYSGPRSDWGKKQKNKKV